VTVLLFTFHAFAYEQAPSIFYAAMNLSVHAVMCDERPPESIA
jgi:hypothetical protein